MVRELATLVRLEGETWALERGLDADLWLQCAVLSEAFVAIADDQGLRAELAGGMFLAVDPPDPHFWAFAWEGGRMFLVDLTATQYIPDAPGAVVLEAGDEMLHAYGLGSIGAMARTGICAADLVDALVLVRRIRAKLAETRSAA